MSNAIKIDSVSKTYRIGSNPLMKAVESMLVIVVVKGIYRLNERIGL